MFYNLDENNNIINPSVVYGNKTSDLSYYAYILAPERFYIYDTETDEIIVNPDFEQEQEAKEQERIARLHLTRGDVFRGLLQAKNVTREQLRALILAMPDGLAKEMALIDFDEALEFYRGNALIDTVGAQLGITTKQMDRFFETNNYTELIREEIIY